MPTFPTISSGSAFRYPITRSVTQRAGRHVFCDFSEQRYRKGPEITEFVLQYNSISVADKETLRTFYGSQAGEFGTNWILVFDGITYPACQFVGPFEAKNIGARLWSVTLRVRTGGIIPASAVLSIIATWTPGGGSALGNPTISAAYGWANIQQIDFSALKTFVNISGISSTPSTFMASLDVTQLNNFSVVCFIVSTLFGTDTPPATLNIYDASLAITYPDGTGKTIRAAATATSQGSASGAFDIGVSGQVANPANAIDGNPATFSSVTRTYFSSLASAGYLQLLF